MANQGPWVVSLQLLLVVPRDSPLASSSGSDLLPHTRARLQTAVGALVGLPPRAVTIGSSPLLLSAALNATALSSSLVDVALEAQLRLIPSELDAALSVGAAFLPGGDLPDVPGWYVNP